jgi:hypothetical protein
MPHDFIVSLGADCYTRMFLNTLRNKKETQLFDYIGTSMWGINDLLENDFAGLTDASHYSVQKVVRNQPPMPVHALYNLRFLHDGSAIKRGPAFAQQLTRRATRFVETILTSQNPLFVRHQEKTDRLWTPKPYLYDELSEIQRFVTLLRTKYGRQQFTVVYVNRDHEGVVDDNIICLKTSVQNGNLRGTGTHIHNRIRELVRR